MHKVEIRHAKELSFSVDYPQPGFSIDARGESGINPVDTLLAALAGCVGVYIRKYSEGAKLGLENFTVRAEAELSREPVIGLKEINVFVDLKGVKIEERRLEALLEFIKNCPVHNTLKGSPEVRIKLTNGN